jgi:phospholipase C
MPKRQPERPAALVMPDIPPAKDRPSHRIMEGFDPAQVSVLSGLATNYAVCDHWFASVPAQTMPNRSFVHAGTACGNVNNPPKGEFNYDAKTIFNILEENRISWAIYSAGGYPSFARLQMQRLWDSSYDRHFLSIDRFLEDAKQGQLPAYCVVEPTFFPEYLGHASSQHPPSDVRAGEEFLDRIWQALRASPCWDHLLLVITYDEHGGCFDHVPPPWGAAPPKQDDKYGNPERFAFDRFGARVPAVLVSPYIEAGTVFRRPAGEVPYDHTSILATVLDWKGLDRGVLGSERVNRAPSFAEVLTRESPRGDRPVIGPASATGEGAAMLRRPIGNLHEGIVVAASHFDDHRGGKGGARVPRRLKQLHALARAPNQQRAAAWLTAVRDAANGGTRASSKPRRPQKS